MTFLSYSAPRPKEPASVGFRRSAIGVSTPGGRLRVQFGLITLIAVTLSACTSIETIPIVPGSIAMLAGKEMLGVKRPMPDFGAMTPGRMAAGSLFGVIGGAVAGVSMVSAGNSLVRENGIVDPAYKIGDELGRAIETKYGIKYVDLGTAVIDDDKVSSVSTAYKPAAFALDIKTLNWGFLYFPVNWNRYRVIYHARMRLIDTAAEKVVAEGGCSSVSDQTDEAPTYDDLVENGARRLQDEIKKAIAFCVTEFSSKYLGM